MSQVVVEVDDWVDNNDTLFVLWVHMHGGLLENRVLVVRVHDHHGLHDGSGLVVGCHVNHRLHNRGVLGSVLDCDLRVH